jgi:hypothetical protein
MWAWVRGGWKIGEGGRQFSSGLLEFDYWKSSERRKLNVSFWMAEVTREGRKGVP